MKFKRGSDFFMLYVAVHSDRMKWQTKEVRYCTKHHTKAFLFWKYLAAVSFIALIPGTSSKEFLLFLEWRLWPVWRKMLES